MSRPPLWFTPASWIAVKLDIQKMNHVDLDDLVLYISSAQLFGFQLNETYFCPVLTNTNYTTMLK